MPNTSEQFVRSARASQNRTSNSNGEISTIAGLGTGTQVPGRHQGVGSHEEYILPIRAPQVIRATGRHRGFEVGMPDHSMGDDEIMFEERDRGGSHTPSNSFNISVITLDETTEAIDTQANNAENESVVEVVQELASTSDDDDDSYYDAATFNEDYNNSSVDVGYEVSVGVPPVSPSERIVLERNRQVNEDEDAIVNDTIDLTDSPLRHSQIASPRQEQPESSPSLKCPVCMEDFLDIRRRGSRLVSTVCGHVFCGKCLPACVRTRGHCPTCRANIGYDDFHPLYLY